MKRDDGRVKRSSGRYEANIIMMMMMKSLPAAAAPVGKSSERVLTTKARTRILRAVRTTRRADARVKG